MGMLQDYDGRAGQTLLLNHWPELRDANDTAVALIMAHDAGQLDDLNKIIARDIAKGILQAVGIIQEIEGDKLAVEEALALYRLKAGLRDIWLILAWHYGIAGSGTNVRLTNVAAEAKNFLRDYDPVSDYDKTTNLPNYRGYGITTGAVLRDLATLSAGVFLIRSS